jgi:hypothetical protein
VVAPAFWVISSRTIRKAGHRADPDLFFGSHGLRRAQSSRGLIYYYHFSIEDEEEYEYDDFGKFYSSSYSSSSSFSLLDTAFNL